MKYTERQKAAIRAWWCDMPLKFRADGSVEGKKGYSWVTLYTAKQAEDHLCSIRML